jgi:hypothetical protein
MGRRTVWLTAVGLLVVAVAVAAGFLRGGHEAAKPKKSAAPRSLALAGGTSGSSTPTGLRKAAAGAGSVTAFTVPASSPLNADLRTLPYVAPNPIPFRAEAEPLPQASKAGGSTFVPSNPHAATQPNIPSPAQNFDGLSFSDVGAGYPPDTVGDVGPNNYIEAVNTGFRIFNKTGGTLVTSTFNTLWSGAATGTPCDTFHGGDPTVIYDAIGNRWILGDFSWSQAVGGLDNGPYYECIAVSQTANPVVGGWYRYGIRTDDAGHPWFSDYPKMGIWPDALYMSANMFDCTASCGAGTTYQDARAYAFKRTDLESGGAVSSLLSDNAGSSEFTLIPGNLRGTLPPANRDEFFVAESSSGFFWNVWKFHADFTTPVNSTFTGPVTVSQASYGCCTFPRIITPVAANTLDSLSDRAMMQAQYRNVSGTESLWATHSVPVGNNQLPMVTQWVQINVTGGVANPSPVQEQIYNPGDGLSRWMAALAVDHSGDMALGYTAADATHNPSVRYTGRLLGDGLGTLPQGEGTFVSGGGAQNNTCGGATCHRWGDYSAMSVDPIDDCTFWYVGEYYIANGSNWNTRIGSFKFTQCTPPTAATVTRFASTRTKQGVVVTWRTATETRIVGFNLYRNGSKLNRKLIAAKKSGTTGGAAYRFVDRTAPRSTTYRLQFVDLKGNRTWHTIGSTPVVR